MDTTTRQPIATFLAVAIAFAAVIGDSHARDNDIIIPAPAVAVPATALDAVDELEPGDFIWEPERAGNGQLVVVVSLPEQRAHVYRNGIRIGVSTISSGKPGKETPTGTFEILQKKRMHHSNLYNNAPMPFMQRLTWDGIALHAGKIPGYPASHGCVRLPSGFAEQLFAETERGMLVVIADEASHGAEIAYPGARAPVDAYSGLPLRAAGGDLGVAAAGP